MDLKFNKKPLRCMRPFFSKVHTQEQTQEIRLPDAYPDIGRVIGCWGQVLMRGKEWHSSFMGATGGVMAWIMYAPEDGTPPRILDVWMPIQCRWDFPETVDDGVMILRPILSALDGRSVSARKMMIRASVDTFAQALGKDTLHIAEPAQMPEDVQLLKRTYPVDLPMEAGEKQVQLEEILSVPGNMPPIHKFMHYHMSPMITEQKVLGNRLVFRGLSKIDMSYLTEDGSVQNWKTEIPFSQYVELDGDYSPSADAWVMPMVTAMELDMTDDQQLLMRGGIAAQYTVFDRNMIDVVEDAFSPKRDVTPQVEQIRIPGMLDRDEVEIAIEGTSEMDRILQSIPMTQYPKLDFDANGMRIRLNGQFQSLGMDAEGQLTGDTVRFDGSTAFTSATENQSHLWIGDADTVDILPVSNGQMLRTTYPVTVQAYSGESIPMVTELELGEERLADPNRPSLILRRAGEEGLWAIAKASGSTVSAIRDANQLEDEPEIGQMLLIPIS